MARPSHYARRKLHNLYCDSLACGRPFTAARADARYCSPACRKAVNRVQQLIRAMNDAARIRANAGAKPKGAKKP